MHTQSKPAYFNEAIHVYGTRELVIKIYITLALLQNAIKNHLITLKFLIQIPALHVRLNQVYFSLRVPLARFSIEFAFWNYISILFSLFQPHIRD
jgi:hypothetical protein